MRQRNLLSFCAVLAVVLMAQAAQAAQIQLSLKLYAIDTDDTTALGPEIVGNGTSATDFVFANGTQFKVGLLAQVLAPTSTDTLRAGTALDTKALGISVLNAAIKGAGSPSSGVAPVRDPLDASNPFDWHGDYLYSEAPAASPGAVSGQLFDSNSDSVDDANGVGYANLSVTLNTVGVLPNFQVGALGSPVVIMAGLYTVNSQVGSTLTVVVSDAALYSELAGAGNDLESLDSLGTLLNATPLTFNQIPEPATAGLLICGLVGLMGSRRRNSQVA